MQSHLTALMVYMERSHQQHGMHGQAGSSIFLRGLLDLIQSHTYTLKQKKAHELRVITEINLILLKMGMLVPCGH